MFLPELRLMLLCSLILPWGLQAVADPDTDQKQPGAALYQQHCAACHDPPGVPRAPSRIALQLMSADALAFALNQGSMRLQGQALNRPQLRTLIGYLSNPETSGNWYEELMCPPERRRVELSDAPAMPMTGVNHANHRYLSAQRAGLHSGQLADLELAWAIAFPQTSSLRAGGVISGSTLFYSATQTGSLLALDTKSGCVKWVYKHVTPLRTSLSIGRLPGNNTQALIFADAAGQVHAVNALTGQQIWQAEGRHDKRVHITGAPVLAGDRIIVPVSARGVGQGRDPNFECCTTHGAVVALSAEDGRQLWTYETMRDAQYTGETNARGVKLRGPSGAPIWSTPSVDLSRGLVYAATGEGTSLPATDTSDAILAIDIADGNLRWSFQALADDIWNLGCDILTGDDGPNCPDPKRSVLKDYDFGAGPVWINLSSDDGTGSKLVIGGQKSGDVWALDADRAGALVWRQTFGMGSALGGIHWGLATDGKRVFVPINDPVLPIEGYVPQPGMNAIDVRSGQVLWQQSVDPDCSATRKARHSLCAEIYGLSAAPLAIDESVVAASTDGRIYIYDAANGSLMWQFDTLRDFTPLNSLPGRGGAIDSQSIFAGDGMLFVGSGYAGFRQPAGNVLLAFRPRERDDTAAHTMPES